MARRYGAASELGQTGSEEKRLCAPRCSGVASEVGGGTRRLSRGWHLSPFHLTPPSPQMVKGYCSHPTHMPRQPSHTNQPHVGVEMSQFPRYLLSWRYHPSLCTQPPGSGPCFPCTRNGYSVNKRLSLLWLFFFPQVDNFHFYSVLMFQNICL